jgi:sulfate permease, SulP family
LQTGDLVRKLADKIDASGRNLILCGAPVQPRRLMRRVEFSRHVGQENICFNVEDAIERANALHASAPPAG